MEGVHLVADGCFSLPAVQGPDPGVRGFHPPSVTVVYGNRHPDACETTAKPGLRPRLRLLGVPSLT